MNPNKGGYQPTTNPLNPANPPHGKQQFDSEYVATIRALVAQLDADIYADDRVDMQAWQQFRTMLEERGYLG